MASTQKKYITKTDRRQSTTFCSQYQLERYSLLIFVLMLLGTGLVGVATFSGGIK